MYVLLFLWYASVLLFYLLILKSSHQVDSVQQITRKDGDRDSCNQQFVFLDTDIQLHITSIITAFTNTIQVELQSKAVVICI